MTFDIQIAARTIWAEARGEIEAGQRAVAHVIVNRFRSHRWGGSLASVCVSRLQFSCWNDSDPNRIVMIGLAENDPALVKFATFLTDALAGEPDPTKGAMHYFNPKTSSPVWAVGNPDFVTIGNHRFVRGVA